MTTTITAPVLVWAHDSGQRYNWAYSQEAAAADRQQWLDTATSLNNMPHCCIGKLQQIPLHHLGERDVYVG